ncbi:MAG: HRDC domain-containing protein [Myxococcota bacterium]|nr:HRDC domain-containing protein [Myxococcota bacterium]
MAEFEIITEAKELEDLATALLREEIIAFDTEADSFYHYFDKTCLVQVATRENAWLIDPLALGGPANLAPLAPVFAAPDVRVLFHAAEYDLFVLKRDCGFAFSNLFDTMVSAQLLGYPAVGLAALIEHHFGVYLPKDEQRSDWSRRPLTPKQLQYAVSDVLYLIPLAEAIEQELKGKGRLEWAMDEFNTLIQRVWPEKEFDVLGYLRIKGAKSLDPVSLGILRELFLVRDARAREIDRPPFKVLGNRTLLDICQGQPRGRNELGRIKGVSELIMRRMGDDLLEGIEKGIAEPHGPIPKIPGPTRRRMDRRTERRLASLKTWRAPRAKELGLDPGVLCPNAALEAIALANPKTAEDIIALPELKRWLAQNFGEELAEWVKKHESGKGKTNPES